MDSTSLAAAILVGDVGVPFASVMTTTFLKTAATTKGVEVPTGDSRGVPAGVLSLFQPNAAAARGPTDLLCYACVNVTDCDWVSTITA
ncbi:hypothetical protein GCM10010483_15550 [Actinokineospora diospyrosa]